MHDATCVGDYDLDAMLWWRYLRTHQLWQLFGPTQFESKL